MRSNFDNAQLNRTTICRLGKLLLVIGSLVAFLLAALMARPVSAHSGGPSPVLLGARAGPYTLSVFADPDTGQGVILAEVDVNGQPAPDGTSVTVYVRPDDNHAPESAHVATREKPLFGRERFVARVPFDAEGVWHVRLVVDGPAGHGEVNFSLTVTPPGFNFARFLCLVPLLALGALWWWGARKAAPQREGRE